MARLHASAHISTGTGTGTGTLSSPSPTFLRSLPPKFTTKTNRVLPRVSVSVRCALSRPTWRESRRLFSVSFVLSQFLLLPNNAIAAGFFDKYVKRKKLEPLEVYVPPVILTQLQIKDLEKTLEVDQPQYSNSRSQLRSGPAASLRVNIRAVAQYASDAGSGTTAFDDVDQCLRALEDLDSMLLRASRNEGETSIKSMKAKIGAAVTALDSLLQTVPSEVLNKGKAIADAYRTADEDAEPEVSDPEIKELESIL